MSDERDDLNGPYCELCGEALERDLCDRCGGEGWLDSDVLMDEDPLWYGPDDTERCEECQGKGGWWWCRNKECKGKAV